MKSDFMPSLSKFCRRVPAQEKMNKINSLTSLRFFAAAMIVVGHGGNAPGFEFFRVGTLQLNNAVSFFYVLSGFILAYTYRDMDVNLGYKKFIIARFSRVWPLHAIMAIICLFVFGPNIFLEYGAPYVNVFLSNITLTQSWIPFSNFYFSYNAVSWSISTEFAFYLLFPLFVCLSKRYGNSILLVPILIPASILLACFLLQLPVHVEGTSISAYWLLYINPMSRLIEFTFGMFVFCLYNRLDNSVRYGTKNTFLELMSIATLVAALAFSSYVWSSLKDTKLEAFGYWYAISGNFVFVGMVVLTFAFQRGIISRAFSNRVFVYLGEISFSIYMCHQVILNYFRIFHADLLKEHSGKMYLFYWALTLLSSVILYHCVEVPARKLIRRSLSKSKKEVAVPTN